MRVSELQKSFVVVDFIEVLGVQRDRPLVFLN